MSLSGSRRLTPSPRTPSPTLTTTIEIVTIPLVVALIRRLEAVSTVAALCGGALASPSAAVMASVLKAVLSLTLCYYDNRRPVDVLTSPTGW